MRYEIDATNKILGRLASEVAVKLRGKDTAQFDPARFLPQQVVVYNTDSIKITGKKMVQKLYRRHSGYPGGFKEETLGRVMARDSRRVIQRAVKGMLPKNKLRDRFMQNLTLYQGGPVQK